MRTAVAKRVDHGLVGRVDGGGVAHAAVLEHDLGGAQRVIDRRRADQPEHRHQLLVHERVAPRASSRSDGSGASSTLSSAPAAKPAMPPSAAHDWPSEPSSGWPVARRTRPPPARTPPRSDEQPRAHPLQLGQRRVPDRVVDDARLLGRADQRRVEGLRDQHVDDGHRHVGAAVDVDRRVAGADAQARLAGRVGRGDRLRAAGGPDEVDAGVVEEVLGDVERRIGDRPAARPGGIPARSPAAWRISTARIGAARGSRRRAEDDGVARLGGDDRLEQHGRRRVGDRRQREHDADRLGDVADRRARASSSITPTDRLSLQVVVEELGGDVVLDHLVLEDAEAGLLHRQPCQLDRMLAGRRRPAPRRSRSTASWSPIAPEGVRRGTRARDDGSRRSSCSSSSRGSRVVAVMVSRLAGAPADLRGDVLDRLADRSTVSRSGRVRPSGRARAPCSGSRARARGSRACPSRPLFLAGAFFVAVAMATSFWGTSVSVPRRDIRNSASSRTSPDPRRPRRS